MLIAEALKYLGGGVVIATVLGAPWRAKAPLDLYGAGVAEAGTDLDKGRSCTNRIMTADTDPAQAVSGTTALLADAVKLADGPFFLTDVRIPTTLNHGFGNVSLYVANGLDCTALEAPIASLSFSSFQNNVTGQDFFPMHGSRFFVPAQRTLCAVTPYVGGASITWAGFRPYSTR